jgi:hypothetical protein
MSSDPLEPDGAARPWKVGSYRPFPGKKGMKMRRSRIWAFGLFASVAATVVSQCPNPAHAESVDLECVSAGSSKLYVSIDLDAHVALWWVPGTDRGSSPSMPADIGDERVTWSLTTETGYKGGLVQEAALDRSTGALNVVSTNNGRTTTTAWTCKRAAKVF